MSERAAEAYVLARSDYEFAVLNGDADRRVEAGRKMHEASAAYVASISPRNSAECPDWGECVDEMVICDEDGMVGPPGQQFLCTGGHHVGFQQYIRCTSSYHDQDGPMSPGIAFLPAHPVT